MKLVKVIKTDKHVNPATEIIRKNEIYMRRFVQRALSTMKDESKSRADVISDREVKSPD